VALSCGELDQQVGVNSAMHSKRNGIAFRAWQRRQGANNVVILECQLPLRLGTGKLLVHPWNQSSATVCHAHDEQLQALVAELSILCFFAEDHADAARPNVNSACLMWLPYQHWAHVACTLSQSLFGMLQH